MKIIILVASHKKSEYPNESVYLPVHAGAIGKKSIGIQPDNDGDNISDKNSYFNEMTVLYWAWKNIESDYVGLVHYRRYFSNANLFQRLFSKKKIKLIATSKDYINELANYDVILPSKRKYYIETIESHFRHLPYTINSDLDVLRDVIEKMFPEYYSSFEKVMGRTWAHMFNMFVMSREKLNEYAEWAFDVLFECDKRINMEGRTRIQARMYISEFLLDTWIETKGYNYKEMNVIYTEKQNWIIKGGNFLINKIKS